MALTKSLGFVMRVQSGRESLLGYGCAVISVVAALLLTVWLTPEVVGLTPLFFAAVVLSAWFGGLGPGLLATVLAGLVSAYFFSGHPLSFWIGADDIIREIVFVAVAVLISYLQSLARRSQAQLRQALDDTAAANAAKDRFLAVLSHELRNPLNPVLSAASFYEHDALLPLSVREDFAMIRRNVELEARLIDDLLDLNRISSGKLAMQFEPTDVHEIIRDAVRICRDDFTARQLRLSLELAAERSFVTGDAARLRQVFWNLLKNAIKFTPPAGTITVRSAETRDQQIRIEVADSGIGIDPVVLPHIFNPFNQGDVSITRQFGGLGLGLSISRMLVEAHGGAIEAHSEGRGLGASFFLTLPLCAHVPAEASAAGGPGAAPADHRAVRILLVEDHEDTCRTMSKLLRSSNHAVSTAGSVGDALDLAGREQFDVVVADIGLPDGSGLDLMRQLKRMYHLRGIALTGFGMHDDVENTREAGFEDHLTKPVDLVKLEAAIQRVACEAIV